MTIDKLLTELEEIIEEGTTFPFVGKARVDKKEIYEIIKQISIKLPDDIKQAQWIMEEKTRILQKAHTESKVILQEAEIKAEQRVDESDIVRDARKKADQIIRDAEKKATELKMGTKEYVESILKKLQAQLNEESAIITENLKELEGFYGQYDSND